MVRNQINQQRQQEWDSSINSRHLYLIQNKASAVRKSGARQKEQIEKYRLRIGLSGINSTQFITGKRWTGLCHQCCKTETLKSFFHAGDITITDTRQWHSATANTSFFVISWVEEAICSNCWLTWFLNIIICPLCLCPLLSFKCSSFQFRYPYLSQFSFNSPQDCT